MTKCVPGAVRSSSALIAGWSVRDAVLMETCAKTHSAQANICIGKTAASSWRSHALTSISTTPKLFARPRAALFVGCKGYRAEVLGRHAHACIDLDDSAHASITAREPL